MSHTQRLNLRHNTKTYFTGWLMRAEDIETNWLRSITLSCAVVEECKALCLKVHKQYYLHT